MELLQANPEGKLVTIKRDPTFSVTLGMCVHREIKLKVFKSMRSLDKCQDPRFDWTFVEGDAAIARSRNRVATSFLESKNDILLFMDDDVAYDCRQLQLMILAMRHYDLDIVGAAYSTKEEKAPVFALRTLTGQESIPFGEEGLIYPVRYVSGGCMAIHRRVFEKMIKDGDKQLCHPDTVKFYSFFDTMEKDIDGKHSWLSEDWAFCERALEAGFKVWVDTRVKLDHIGEKVYNWDDFVRPPKEKMDNLLYQVNVTKE